VPQLAFPEVFKVEVVVLHFIRCLFTQLREQVRDSVDIHIRNTKSTEIWTSVKVADSKVFK